MKVAIPNRSGGDDKLTCAAPSSTFLSDPPPVPSKSRKGTTGIPAQALKIAKTVSACMLQKSNRILRWQLGKLHWQTEFKL